MIRAGVTPVRLGGGSRELMARPVGSVVTGQGATAFSPASIAGLVAWYDWSDISTLWQDTGRTSPITADAQSIAGVTDKSGAASHLQQATAGQRPVYKTAIQNGLSVARMDGVDDYFEIPSPWNGLGTATAVTCIYVSNPANDVNNQFTTGYNSSPGSSWSWQMYKGSSKDAQATVWGNVGGSSHGSGANQYLGAAHVQSNVFDAALASNETTVYVDGTVGAGGHGDAANTTAANFSNAANRRLTIGNRGDGGPNPLKGDMMECLIWNLALTDPNRQSVEAYLKAKWGTP